MRRRAIPVFPVLAILLLAACGPDPEERRASIYRLKSDPTADNMESIRASLEDADRDVRATALHALVSLGAEDAADLALGALDDPDGFVRATGAKLLGDLGDPGHAEPLAGCLRDDPDAVARQRAAESLTRLGGSTAVEALAAGLADPMEKVRQAAVKGLGDLDPRFAVDELARILREDTVWEIRAQAAHTLGLTGDPEVEAALQGALEDPNEFVRSAAANALKIHEDVREGRRPAPAGSPPPSPAS